MSASSKRKIVFLFGSGASIPAGMPKTQDITERILSGEGIYYQYNHFSSQLRRWAAPILEEVQRSDVQRIIKFLEKLKVEVDSYYQKRIFKQDTNYEDLYYVANQISASIYGNHDNPVVQSFIDRISPDIKQILVKPIGGYEWRLEELSHKAQEYIKFVIFYLLNKEPACLNHLSLLKDYYFDSDNCKLEIFTLNHDTVIEQFFNKNQIDYVDGFSKAPELIDGIQLRR
ncbi:MAG: hypothetical protein ACRENZ_04705, partial [Thermodesulfobacteriota bacterium]